MSLPMIVCLTAGLCAGASAGPRPGLLGAFAEPLMAATALIGGDDGGGVAAGWLMNGSDLYYNSGDVGIGTANPTSRLHVVGVGAGAIWGFNNATTGTAYGVYGRTASTSGTAVYGLATTGTGANFGLYGQTNSTAGRGGYGFATAASGLTYGLYGRTNSTTGIGTYGFASATSGKNYGLYGRSNSLLGYGSYGFASATSGKNYGSYGVTSSTSGTGSYGGAVALNGVTYGVWGQANSAGGTGLYGWAPAASGSTYGAYGRSDSDTGYGLYGYAPSTDAGSSNYAIYGKCPNLSMGYGLMLEGNFAATGMKAFKIDHPLDPANKFLSHYCAEGPEPLLVYRGNAVLDGAGRAWVELPSYFESINRDYTYQLTPIGAPAALYIANEISDGQFEIAGGLPGMKVSWAVTGVRDDAAARVNGAPVEEDKAADQRGKYFHPELYGQPVESSLQYFPVPEDRSEAHPLE